MRRGQRTVAVHEVEEALQAAYEKGFEEGRVLGMDEARLNASFGNSASGCVSAVSSPGNPRQQEQEVRIALLRALGQTVQAAASLADNVGGLR